jgi:hypothetical protein
MAIIVNEFQDNALKVSQEEIANTLQITNNWTHLRVGVLLQISQSHTGGTPNSSQLSIGVCSGTGSLMGSALGPTYFCGLNTFPGNTYTSVYYSSLNFFWYADLNSGSFSSSIGTQVGLNPFSRGSGSFKLAGPTLVGISPNGTNIPNTASNASYFPIYLDFVKSGSTPTTTPQLWTVVYYGYLTSDISSGTPFMMNISDFYTYLEILNPMFSNGFGGDDNWTSSLFTVPVSESIYGTLDSLNVLWNHTIPMTIHEIALYRFS